MGGLPNPTSSKPRYAASANERQVVRQEKTQPLVAALKTRLEKTLIQLASGSSIAQAIRYGLNHWDGLARFLDDGCIKIDSDTVEPAFARLLCLKAVR